MLFLSVHASQRRLHDRFALFFSLLFLPSIDSDRKKIESREGVRKACKYCFFSFPFSICVSSLNEKKPQQNLQSDKTKKMFFFVFFFLFTFLVIVDCNQTKPFFYSSVLRPPMNGEAFALSTSLFIHFFLSFPEVRFYFFLLFLFIHLLLFSAHPPSSVHHGTGKLLGFLLHLLLLTAG